MVLLGAALIFAFLVSLSLLGVYALLRLLARKSLGKSLPKLGCTPRALILVVGTIGLTPLAFHILWQGMFREGSHVMLQQAAEDIRREFFPSGASDISYHLDYQGKAIDFAIGEDGFLEWTASKGWKTDKVGEGNEREQVYWTRSIGNYSVDTEITNGYYFEAVYHPRGTGEAVAYDISQGRAYYRYSHY